MTSLLSPTHLAGREGDAVADHEHADALGPAELVGAEADEVSDRRELGDVGPAEGLHRVGVEHGVGGEAAHDLGRLGQGLQGADLVVGRHDRHEPHPGALPRCGAGGLGLEHDGEVIEVEATGGIDADRAASEGEHRVEHGMVLDRRAHDGAVGGSEPGSTGPAGAEHGEVVGLGTAAREHDLTRLGADELGDDVAGVVDGPAGVAGHAVGTGGVGEAHVEERQHGVDGLGAHRRGGRMVEVGAHGSSG